MDTTPAISFQSDNQVGMSLLITAVILGILAILYALYKYRHKTGSLIAPLANALRGNGGIILFKVLRLFIALIGLATLLATLLPGLMPFGQYYDSSLELGGLIFLFLWPLMVVQIAVALVPLEKYMARQPLALWIGLAVVGWMALRLDVMSLDAAYNFPLDWLIAH